MVIRPVFPDPVTYVSDDFNLIALFTQLSRPQVSGSLDYPDLLVIEFNQNILLIVRVLLEYLNGVLYNNYMYMQMDFNYLNFSII